MAKNCKPCAKTSALIWIIPVFVVLAVITTKKARENRSESTRAQIAQRSQINVDDVEDEVDRKLESIGDALDATARKLEMAAEKVATKLQAKISGKSRSSQTSSDTTAPQSPEPPKPPKLESPDVSDAPSNNQSSSMLTATDSNVDEAQPPVAPVAGEQTTDAVAATNELVQSTTPLAQTGTSSNGSTSEPNQDTSVDGKVDSTDAVANTQGPDLEITTSVLNAETPEWVKKGTVNGDTHIVPISSSMFGDVQQCRDDLDARLVDEVTSYLNENVLLHRSAARIPELNLAYIKDHLLAQSVEFDNVQNRSSGLYHQLWVKMVLTPETVTSLRAMERPVITAQRTEELGFLGGLIVAATASVSWGVGLLARRERAKLSRS